MAAGGELYLPTATFDELCSVPGMGPALARRVLEYRQSGGRLAQPDDLLSVPGVSPALLARLRPRLRFDLPHTPTAARIEPAAPASTGEPDAPPLSPPLRETTSADRPAGTTWRSATPEHQATEAVVGPAVAEAPELEPTQSALPPCAQPATEPPARPAEPTPDSTGRRPAFNDDEEWPRSYNGVNPAVIFGEGDRAVAATNDGPAPSGFALSRVQLALLLALYTLLGAALSVVAIYALNQTLHFVPSRDWQRQVVLPLATVQAESAALSAGAQSLEEAVATLQARADGAASLLTDLQSDSATLGTRVEELEQAQADVEALSSEIDALQKEVTTMQGRVDRFGGFLESLSAALQTVLP